MRFLRVLLLAAILLGPGGACAALGQDSLTVPLPNSPAFYSYSTNTYTELGWYELLVSEQRGIAGFSIDYTWNTLDGFFGTFYAQSPSGTVFIIGFAENGGIYTKSADDFDDEWGGGSWIFWVEDVQGAGEQQATDVTVTFDFVPANAPFGLQATTTGSTARLVWSEAAEADGLLGYRVHRDGVPIADLAPGVTTHDDENLALGTYCYVVTALFDSGPGGSTDEDCTTIYPAGTYGLPDSPTDPYRYHSYQETGWTDVEVIDRGIVENWSIEFGWTNLNGYGDGSLHAESPAGTLLTVASGVAGGSYTIDSDRFDGESAFGNWKVWIEDDDTFGDGQYQVTDATMTLELDRTVPTDLDANTVAWVVFLDWLAPQEDDGLVGYNVYRHDSTTPIGSTDAATTTFVDTDISPGMTACYQVAADYGIVEKLWPSVVCAGAPGTYPVGDSPPPNQPNTYYCNSWTEAGWTELEVAEQGGITGWHISYDWTTNWAEMGRFYAMSPSGTQLTIGQGQAPGHHAVDSAVFNGEQMQGSWRIWIVDDDFFCDGMHRATGISMVIDASGGSPPGEVPPAIVLERSGEDELRIRWQASDCHGADDYGIYEGTIGDWYGHSLIDCADDGGDLQETVVFGSGDRYYLVVPRTQADEGSYGLDSAMGERPVGVAACAPAQQLGCR